MVLLNPGWLTSFAVFLTAFGTITLYQIGSIHIRPYQVPLVVSVLIIFSQFLLNKRRLFIPTHFYILFLFLLTVMISIINAKFPVITLKQTILLLVYIILFFLIINTCNTEKKLLLLYRFIIISCFFVCVYGMYMMVIENLPGVPKVGGYLFNRPKSFFAEPNEFGQYLVFIFGYIFSELISKRKIVGRIFLWINFLLILILLVANISRGSWLGFLIIICSVIYYQNKFKLRRTNFGKIFKIIVLFLTLWVTGLFFASEIISTSEKGDFTAYTIARIFSLAIAQDETFLIRLENNKKAVETMIECPFTGIGFGNVGTISGGDYKYGGTSSNFLSDIGAETGIFGLASFLFFLIAIFKKGLKNIKNTKNEKTKIIFIGALGSYIGLLVNGLTYASHILPFLWISAGILSTKKLSSLD